MNARITLVSATALAVLAGSTLAQSLNIDVNKSTNAVVPAASYAGAAGQPGTWNNVFAGTSGTVNLVGLDGTPSAITVTRAGSGGGDNLSIAGASSDFNTLMSDFQMSTGVVQGPEFTVNGLAPGFYRVYVYAALPGAAGFYTDSFGGPVYYTNYVNLTLGGVAAGSSTTSGPFSANTFTQGLTHARFDVTVPAGAPALKIAVKTGSGNNEKCALNGFQIVKYPSNRIYVDPTKAGGAKTGESWANAMTDLQAALTLVKNSGGNINEIWVAKGVYYPTTTTDRTKSFVLVSGAKMYGGFAGTETTLAQRDLSNPENTTYLSGDIGTRRSIPDNSYHVITGLNLSTATLLDGFNVSSGKANGVLGNGEWDGSLMRVVGSSLTVKNVTFSYGDSHGFGGAVYAKQGAPVFVDCTFSSNLARVDGGGLFWESTGVVGAPSMKVFNCVFTGNDAYEDGAALYSAGGYPVIANCVMNGNDGDTLMGMLNTNNTDVMSVYNCTFSGNVGSVFGTEQNAMQNFYNCIIWNNERSGAFTPLSKTGWATPFAQNVTLTGCCIQGYSNPAVPGLANQGWDPMFVDAAGSDGLMGTWDDDLRLSPFSPLIDRGLNAYIPTDACDLNANGNTSEAVPFDLDGNTRLFDVPFAANTGLGFGALIDLGAYENHAVTPPCGTSDFNGDGDFGTDQDIEAFFACLAGNCCQTCFPNGSDFNGDSDYGTDADIEAFFRVLAGGNC
jgi:hypothetical protein